MRSFIVQLGAPSFAEVAISEEHIDPVQGSNPTGLRDSALGKLLGIELDFLLSLGPSDLGLQGDEVRQQMHVASECS